MSEPPSGQHRNDIYGDLEAKPSGDVVPAATVVLVRDAASGADAGTEVLMLRKSSKIAFGGMWVFPGGRIDEDDRVPDSDSEAAARRAAVREAYEEASVVVSPESLVWFAHWSPPPSTKRRFATWFFAAGVAPRSGDGGTSSPEVTVDGGEILEHEWISPAVALERHAAGEIDLAPPTWVTLYHLSRYRPTDELLAHLGDLEPTVYETHVSERSDGVRVAMWRGDAGYDDWNADAAGERHRLVMARGGFTFEHAETDY